MSAEYFDPTGSGLALAEALQEHCLGVAMVLGLLDERPVATPEELLETPALLEAAVVEAQR
ncbi:MAG: hypothetical protein ACYTG0_34810 [Planctomycetota bacterium]|jgi:hypothetical protein